MTCARISVVGHRALNCRLRAVNGVPIFNNFGLVSAATHHESDAEHHSSGTADEGSLVGDLGDLNGHSLHTNADFRQ